MSEALQITHEEQHRDLVRRLAAEIKPTRRLRPVGVRLGLLILVEAGVLTWVATHTTNHFTHKFSQPAYALEVVFFSAAAIISAVLALRSAIPGRALRPGEAMLATALVVAGTILVIVSEPVSIANPLGDFVRTGRRCAFETWMFAAPPLLVLWWMVRRGAAMRGRLSGLLAGAGALFFSFAIMRLACPIDEPIHLLVWHLLPAFALIALSTLAGGVWLRFPASIRRRAT